MRGRFDSVYQGTIHADGTKVALKFIRRALFGDVNTINLVLKEVHLWSKLRHENVLPLIGITTKFDLTISIVSQWMEKGNAHDYVQDTTIDPRPLVTGIARGLHYLHNHQPGAVIHGDLKGLNVLIAEDGRALLTDFGLSYLGDSSFSISIPLVGEGCTLNWASPEILDGCRTAPKADVWAFGMTTLELFTHKNPFYGFTKTAVTCRITQGRLPERPSKETTYARMSDGWWNLCVSCWNRDPLRRPEMSEIVERIGTVCLCHFSKLQ
ncbi:hypothetical protein ID866_8208 [Astraeus odoratus]|nr:hypothetical protein ID866_8208 [Astraeus odoratus]